MEDGGDVDQAWVTELVNWCRDSLIEGDGGGADRPFQRFRQACIDRGLPADAQLRSWQRARAALIEWSRRNRVTERLLGDEMGAYQAPEVRASADMVAYIRDHEIDIEGADELEREALSEAFLRYELSLLDDDGGSDNDSIVEAEVSHHSHPLLPQASKVGAFRWWRRYKKRDGEDEEMEDEEADFVSTVVLCVGEYTRLQQPLWVGRERWTLHAKIRAQLAPVGGI